MNEKEGGDRHKQTLYITEIRLLEGCARRKADGNEREKDTNNPPLGVGGGIKKEKTFSSVYQFWYIFLVVSRKRPIFAEKQRLWLY